MGKQRCAFNSLAHFSNAFRIFFAEKMPAETRLGALSVFKFDDLDTLDSLFTHPEQTGSDLSNYMIVIRLEILRITAFACAGKGIPNCRIMGFRNHRWQAN